MNSHEADMGDGKAECAICGAITRNKGIVYGCLCSGITIQLWRIEGKLDRLLAADEHQSSSEPMRFLPRG